MTNKTQYKSKKIVRSAINSILGMAGFKIISSNERKFYSNLEYLENVDFESKKDFNKKTKREKKEKLVFNWLIPHIGKGGGGHTVIFRFIKYLNEQGHTNRIYIIDDHKPFKVEDQYEFIKEHYFDIGKTEIYRGARGIKDSDVNISTSWETCYYSFYADNTKFKGYLVLDFEPYFYPMSVDYVLAEQTYKMGYYGFFGGEWLTQKLGEEYGMQGIKFDLGVDLDNYKLLENIDRDPDKLFVYFRSWSKRRGAELIIPALEKIYEKRPQTKIVLAGEEHIPFDLPFEYENIGVTLNEELAKIYNSATLALVFSLTNYSLLPHEAQACGAMVVELDTKANRANYGTEKSDYIVLAKPNPHEIAEKVIYYLDNKKEREQIVKKSTEHVKKLSWNIMFEKFENTILKEFN